MPTGFAVVALCALAAGGMATYLYVVPDARSWCEPAKACHVGEGGPRRWLMLAHAQLHLARSGTRGTHSRWPG